MEGIVPELRWSAKERLIRQMRRCSDAKQKVRYLIIVNLLNGRTVVETAKAVQVGRSTVYDVARRFRERGEAGLIDMDVLERERWRAESGINGVAIPVGSTVLVTRVVGARLVVLPLDGAASGPVDPPREGGQKKERE